MKLSMFYYLLVVFAALISCSEEEVVKKGSDADVTHTGVPWRITSFNYTLIDQSTSGQTFKSGTIANPGLFYFDTGKGSFEFDVEGYHKEDVFSFSDASGSLTITVIDQSVGGGVVSQNVLAISGTKFSETEITLDGTMTKQSSVGGQFVLTGTFNLVKN